MHVSPDDSQSKSAELSKVRREKDDALMELEDFKESHSKSINFEAENYMLKNK